MLLKFVFLLQFVINCYSISCDSLPNSCPVTVGTPLNNGELFEISPNQRLFFNLHVSLSFYYTIIL